ncbi:YdiU family protein [Croceitalea sp. MTPC5]|uniref:protein adenylyltransferase SelO n=1 Tax=Croceitalea sp. MTPC5 TaxID=3056565 RepID=UPI002B399A0D|nr:YdiU family protein [Croceitalea sp. MTPC5]
MNFNVKNSFVEVLPKDSLSENIPRIVEKACYSHVSPTKTSEPEIVHVSEEMANDIGFKKDEIKSPEFLKVFTGNKVMKDIEPYAMCYGGHQFGSWSGQLGDGRAINLFEIICDAKRWAVQLKGAGKTPYSRGGDGRAVLRSSIREYLGAEAMHNLGIPSTRSLSLALTGDLVKRDMFYNGNIQFEKGAIVTRLSPSFLRFGSYEIFTKRNDLVTLKILVDYTINNFFPSIDLSANSSYLLFFQKVVESTLKLITNWLRVGFVHGVMNTDNMSILGLTMDYGPFGWMDEFDENWTPNWSDFNSRRYSYQNQIKNGFWNLARFGESLLPLIKDKRAVEEILEEYQTNQKKIHLKMIKSKIGLYDENEKDEILVKNLIAVLQLTEIDFTIFFRNLSKCGKNTGEVERNHIISAFNFIKEAFYAPSELKGEVMDKWYNWFWNYLLRLQKEDVPDNIRRIRMNNFNPKYILRNYMTQIAINHAEQGDYSLIEELYSLLMKPYDEQVKFQKWFKKGPDWARKRVGYSILSCSS